MMTQIRAEVVAKGMFGDTGIAYIAASPEFQDAPYVIGFRVQALIGEELKTMMGRGKTWEEAVLKAKENLEKKTPLKYQQDPKMQVPSRKKRIRRYMHIEKFQMLLEKYALWFARADQLGDKFEGSLPITNLLKRPIEYEQQANFFRNIGVPVKRTLLEYYLAASESFAQSRLRMFINCWQVSDYESESMWKAYIPDGQGICIESNFASLRNAFVSKFYPPISAGLVKYVDFETEEIDTSSLHSIVLTKRKEFESDKELRAILLMPQFAEWMHSKIPLGIPVTVNVKSLIHNVIVSPFARPDLLSKVQRLCAEYDIPNPVNSKLSQPARF